MKKGGIVYSTNHNLRTTNSPDYQDVKKNDFILSICFEKKGRAGKGVTIIKGFEGNPNKLKELSKEIKTSLGVGGSNKSGEIILQGRIQEKIINLLNKKGYKTKKVGG
tara:strand:- start:1 stop:324 length:324 start_codon:yes stop_codon:yes gene_type:complete